MLDDYFVGSRIRLHTPDADGPRGTITERGDLETPLKSWLAELDEPAGDIGPAAFATWDLPASEITAEIPGGMLHAPACDDLAAAAAAMDAFDRLGELRAAGEETADARLLFTRAEEVGFIGAIAACKHGAIPPAARLLCLENSRSYPESPIGGGPIVRVGDRATTFSPALTASVYAVAQDTFGGPANPGPRDKQEGAGRWQRKLMPGGVCEASVFCAYGYEATCLCLPLGNYHNMADLAAVQAGTNTNRPRVGREHVALADFAGMVGLLVGCGEDLPGTGGLGDRLAGLWASRGGVLA